MGTVPTAQMMDFLSLTTEPGVPPHALRLKPGCICSIMRNLSVDDGLVNNTRVIITRLNQFTVEVKTLPSAANDFTSQVFCLPRINFEFQLSCCPWIVYSTDNFLCGWLTQLSSTVARVSHLTELFSTFAHLCSLTVNCTQRCQESGLDMTSDVFLLTTNFQSLLRISFTKICL